MIERKFVNQNIKEFEIKEFVKKKLSRVGLSDVKLQRTPLGEKIVISTSRPGLVVGRSGSNITRLTQDIKNQFELENPQIEIEEVNHIGLDSNIIAEMIANSLEKFGPNRFKGIGHKAMSDVMNAGALGVEILVSGKLPGARARTWRFYQGYLKKCGDIAISDVKTSYTAANLKSGTIGIKVSIMTPDTELPDDIKLVDKTEGPETVVEEVSNEKVKEEMKHKTEEAVAEKNEKQQAEEQAEADRKKGKQQDKKASARKKTSEKQKQAKTGKKARKSKINNLPLKDEVC